MLAPADGPRRVLTFIILTVSSDIGGYFAGITLGRPGRHLMAPVISPKKTWEGFAGSAVACLVAGWLCVTLMLHGHAWQGLLTGAAVVLAAILGDLVESVIKRDLDIKDMGTLLPGHGGVLERLDSLLVVAPAVVHGVVEPCGQQHRLAPRVVGCHQRVHVRQHLGEVQQVVVAARGVGVRRAQPLPQRRRLPGGPERREVGHRVTDRPGR